MADKVISIEDRTGYKNVFYREKKIAILPDDYTSEDLAEVIEKAVDELCSRKDAKIDAVVPVLTDLLNKLVNEAYRSGQLGGQVPPKSIISQIIDSIF